MEWILHRWLHNGPKLTVKIGCAIAQAVSRRLPTPAARVQAQVRSCGIPYGSINEANVALYCGAIYGEVSKRNCGTRLISRRI
jgi:hypothetical protein